MEYFKMEKTEKSEGKIYVLPGLGVFGTSFIAVETAIRHRRPVRWASLLAMTAAVLLSCTPKDVPGPDSQSSPEPCDIDTSDRMCIVLDARAEETGVLGTGLGFLHGFGDWNGFAPKAFTPSMSLLDRIAELTPQHWRLTNHDLLELALQSDSTTTVVLSDPYAFARGGHLQTAPWDNWPEWEDYVTTAINASLTSNRVQIPGGTARRNPACRIPRCCGAS